MAKTKRYLLVTECETTGYIIGFFDDLEEAEKAMEELSAKQGTFWSTGISQEFEKAMNYQSYKIHPLVNQTLIENCPRGTCDGHHILNIFDTEEVENFSLNRFIFERANTINLYDVNIFSKLKKRFLTLHPEFIAN